MKNQRVAWPVLAFPLLALACAGAPDVPFPTDAELTGVFESQRAVLDGLVSQPDDSVALAALGLTRGRYNVWETDTTAYFQAWYRDLAGPGGCAKGIAYLSTEPRETVDAIGGELSLCPPEELSLHVPLGDNWYLYYTASN